MANRQLLACCKSGIGFFSEVGEQPGMMLWFDLATKDAAGIERTPGRGELM